MTENEIKVLMKKYLNGTITKEEESLLEEFDFEPDLEHFAITGTCSECRSENPGVHQH